MGGDLALRLGDDALVLSHRLSAWCGHAPMLELDLALANIGLDLLGQAQFFLALAGSADGLDADALAYRRGEEAFRNCLLVEQPNGDFARTIARQFLFSAWQELVFRDLADRGAPDGGDPAMAAIAGKAVKEVTYHARFAGEWVVRLGDGTTESRRRMVEGIDWCWRFVDELFGGDEAWLRPAWDARVDAVFVEAGLDRPKPVRGIAGGRVGRHSEHLGHLLAEMQYLQRSFPDAVW